MNKRKELVIVGTGEFGQMAYDYFMNDSEYEVVAFAVEKKYYQKEKQYDLPVIRFESLPTRFSPEEVDVFVAVTYVQMNKARERLFCQCKIWGYTCATYISSWAYVSHKAKVGENVFIMENSTIQIFSEVEDNVIIWGGTFIGHHSKVSANCWIAASAALGGFCNIGQNSFLGLNSTIKDQIIVEEFTLVGAGAYVAKQTEKYGIYAPARSIDILSKIPREKRQEKQLEILCR